MEAAIPQFDCAYELELNAMLETLGIRRAFDEMQADFTAMAVSDEGNLYIGTAKHQTFIRIDRTGTKAGAATTVEMMNFGFGDPPAVTLDRPFVYMILDNATDCRFSSAPSRTYRADLSGRTRFPANASGPCFFGRKFF